MSITEKEIQQSAKEYLSKNFTVKNNESRKAELAYLAGVRMVLEKTGMQPHCDHDCADFDSGRCAYPNNCIKFYF